MCTAAIPGVGGGTKTVTTAAPAQAAPVKTAASAAPAQAGSRSAGLTTVRAGGVASTTSGALTTGNSLLGQ